MLQTAHLRQNRAAKLIAGSDGTLQSVQQRLADFGFSIKTAVALLFFYSIIPLIKNTLNHLPERKQGHIASLLQIIHEEFDQVVKGATLDEKTRSRILLVILFGSYAKGTQVDDPKSGYFSDYDILVVLNEPALTDEYKIWHTVEECATSKTGSPVNLVVCTLREINHELKQGHYFFTDIREQGIELYNYNHTALLNPGPLNSEEVKKLHRNILSNGLKVLIVFLLIVKKTLKGLG